MKHLLLITATIFILSSCSKDTELLNIGQDKALTGCYSQNDTRSYDAKDCIVDMDDINAYVKFKTLLSRGTKVVNIAPFPNDSDPLLFVINYEDSWELISGDKRTTAVIASGEGLFDVNSMNENCLAWIQYLSSGISVLRNSNKKTKNAFEYLSFWKYITADLDFIWKETTTRSGPDTTYHPVPGHYELDYVEEFIIEIDSIDHLIPTKWGQAYPYNQYCPLDYSYSPEYDAVRCLTGCVPLSGAQIVNYFHKSGIIMPICDSAYVNTREYPYTDWSQMRQWHRSEDNWAKMSSADSSRMAAILIAEIGKGISVEYHYYPYWAYDFNNNLVLFDGSSYASLGDLHSYLDQEYLMNSLSYFNEYSYDYIYELLQDNYPSIVGASGSPNINGHAFIIDRYKRSLTRYHFCYLFYPDDPDDPNADPPGSDGIIYMYNSPETIYFGMNWGYYGQHDDTWCVKSGDWFCGNDNYLYRHLIITFRDNLEDADEPNPDSRRK